MDFRKVNFKILTIIVGILLVLITGYAYNQLGPYEKSSKKEIVVEVPKGATIKDIAQILKNNKLIKNKFLFRILEKVTVNKSQIKAGFYMFNQKDSNFEILKILYSGKTYNNYVKVTIPEGLTYKEVIKVLADKNLGEYKNYEKLINSPKNFYKEFPFLKEKDIKTLEGFLYPDTYYFIKESKEKYILEMMLSRFKKIYNYDFKQKQEKMDLSLQEVINLASIIEKEAIIDKDRPIIASVFYNRLKIDMPLQSDATIQYIFDKRKKRIAYSDLKIDSKYNSYLNKGLPPTPIANPGVNSIKAALYPSNTDYLYFVATINGENNYSKTYEEHIKKVKLYKQERDKVKNK